MTFNDSITKYRSVYFHFLDGLLNTITGGSFANVKSTLQEIAQIDLNHINFININYSNYTITFREIDSIIDYKDDNIFKIPLNYLKFCIIPMSFNDHATTTIIFIKGTQLYLFILNSGLDIQENGKEQTIDGQVLYQLTKGIILCDNINDPLKLEKAYKSIKDFLFIGLFYKNIKDDTYFEKKSNEYPREYPNNDSYFFKNDFKKLLEKFKNIFGSNFDNIFSLNNIPCTIDELLNRFSEKYRQKFFKIRINYYVLASKFIDIQTDKQTNIGNIININEYNNSLITSLKTNEQISENFLRKIILYNKDKNLYIYPQESGSCSWYSIYFSMLLFYNDKDEHIQFINKINTKFYEYIKKIYTKDTFQEVLKSDKDTYFYMKQLCSKLIDIKLIDDKLLYEQQDIIYNTDLKLEFEDASDLYYYFNNTDHYYDDDSVKLISNMYNSFSSSRKPINFYLTAYLIFQEQKNFFNEKIDFKLILDKLKIFLSSIGLKSHYENISNYLILFKNTYELKLETKTPSNLTYFIPIILYINNNNNSPPLELDFNDNKNNLFECCLVFYRLYLITRIINYYDKNTKKSKDISELCDLTILPLINNVGNSKFDYQYKLYQSDVIDIKDDLFNLFSSRQSNANSPENGNLIFDSFNENFDNLIKIEEYLFENPKFITEDYLIININRINNYREQKLELIKFYCNNIHNNYNNEYDNNYKKLYILLFDAPDPHKRSDFIKICYVNFDYFKIVILNLKKEYSNSFEIFFNKIINEKNIIFGNQFNIIPKYNFEKSTIKEINFQKIHVTKGFFSKETILVQSNIKQGHDFDIYQVINNVYINYKCNCSFKHNTILFKILKICFNNNEVLKFDSIIYPFKYLIPNTHLYYIYNKNGVYNIAFNFVNNIIKDCILGNKKLENGIYNYEINPNNQFFLNKFSNNKNSNFENWNNLCCDLQLNSYNIMYVNLKNKDINQNGYSCNDKRYPDIFNFDKSTLFNKKIKYELKNFKLLNKESESKDISFEYEIDKLQQLTESYKKLLFKISKCNIQDSNKLIWINRLQIIKSTIECKIKKFTNYIKKITLGDLLNNYLILQSYLLNVKIYNFINKLLNNISNNVALCSIIKNYNLLFDTKKIPYKYNFQILFELINGNEILEEQMDRYLIMTDSYNKYKGHKGGGIPNIHTTSPKLIEYPDIHTTSPKLIEYPDELKDNIDSLINIKLDDISVNIEKLEICKDNFYQLHHFMMGKGKSAIITPLLSLYFNIIKNQYIYIIVPKHLVKQTEETLKDYIDIFEIKNIYIKSEDEIKKDFLNGKFIASENTVLLFDEFDSLINPLKSKFNYVLINDTKIKIDDISSVIKIIINDNKGNFEKISKEKLMATIRPYQTIKNQNLFADNLISIIDQLNKNTLKYNIQWGINSDKLYAIPFRSKDKPIENSSFTSCIMTIFLTYYYYIIINNYKIDENILNFIKKNNYFKKIIKLDETKLNIESVNNILTDESIKNDFYNYLFQYIFSKINLQKETYNTSFIDILNIDKVFKIGYSGTVNINLPVLDNNYTFNKDCLFKDEDESNNIKYAIEKSEILLKDISKIFYINEEKLIEDEKLKEYDALIDVCGYYFNILNYKIALEIHKILNLSRDVIFIDENDEKMVIIDGKLEKLNEYIKYNNPFFYYDQSHIVGSDIKQDNYPILKGLCIVDNLSYYSEVAQAMFRLRKLNLGHSISFVLNNFSVSNNSELYCKFRQNENNLIEKQKDSLNLQALKSNIRKKRQLTRCNFMENYKENIFYYFDQDLDHDYNGLKLIFTDFTDEQIRAIDLKKYNLTPELIKNMIFNLDFTIQNSEVQYQVNIQENVETQNLTQIQTQYEYVPAKSLDKIYDFLKKFDKYKFKNFDFMKEIKTQVNYDKYTFKLDSLLSFLPNIFYINKYSPIYCMNFNSYYLNIDLIFVYIDDIQKFILIPKCMVLYLYDDFLMYDLNINIINFKKINLRNINKEKELEDNIFVKIITNNFTQDDFKLLMDNLNIVKTLENSYCLSALIFFYRVMNKESWNDYFYNPLWLYLKDNLAKNIDTLDLNKHNDLIRNVINIEAFRKKYLKYKAKYLNLKKNL